ncbi:hypothetical protein HX099_11445 [Thiopseudomonas alkaliphila]|uniref:Chromosome partitioning protein ParA n=1 Tax=Thiopseudomonas alkaliphila TaxID=1697053 RepID=A0AAW7DTB9_9GAMM|nr:chromosome partitioning protein ParA [Thiopseudomonas alkaliphila]MDM1697265.1 hypothetical protein [Thiopseudomonas alkaliphila]
MDNMQQGHKKDKTEDSKMQYLQQSLEKQAAALAEKESELKDLQQRLNNQEQFLKQREEALAKDKQSLNARSLELEARHQEQERRQLEIEQGLPALRDKFFAERDQQLAEERQTLKEQRAELVAEAHKLQVEREKLAKIQEAAEGDFAEQRAELQRALQQERSAAISKLHNEIQQRRESDFKALEAELQQRRDELKKREDELEQEQVSLINEQNSVRLKQAEVQQLQESLEQNIQERTKTRLLEIEQKERQFEQDKQRLLSRIERQDALHSAFDELKKQLGDRAPEEVLRDLTAKSEELIVLREELKRPSEELEEVYDRHRTQVANLEQKNEVLQKEIRELQHDLDTQEQLEYDQECLETKYRSLEVRYDATVRNNNELKEELERLSPSYNNPESIEKRIKNIKRPYIQEFVPRRQEAIINELDWLEAIRSSIDDYGLHFSYRILCAFHTALKIAEWSPLTVLAGVSGTGKSELPKLYSRFGGINFINVPVQPNWDSQESMLGYFNSISNSYEAQPMLNFLVQSREKLVNGSDNPEDNYNGLADTVSLVLLDEMNLAHVELYFADFLSKLEQRRGAKNSELPHIDINLGSDIDPYKLSLGRNLLFAGTMNQDETTKSLSDKVIDRGTSIYFPRPNSLHRREKLKVLPEQANLLKMSNWWKWINKQSDLSVETIKPYKQLIEDINQYLGADGKALGHRVWQSIEYYMVNHPLVMGLEADQYPDEYKDALKFAFEDQLVQKVMPKLRGIETRGYAKEHCLDPIRELLAKEKLDILDDFDKAMRIGHGQFSWASADYLNNTQSNERYEELFRLALNAPISKQKTEAN